MFCPSLLGKAASLHSFTGQVSSGNKENGSAVTEEKCWVTLSLPGLLLHFTRNGHWIKSLKQGLDSCQVDILTAPPGSPVYSACDQWTWPFQAKRRGVQPEGLANAPAAQLRRAWWMGRHGFSQQQQDVDVVLCILMAALKLGLYKGWKGELAPPVRVWKEVKFNIVTEQNFQSCRFWR